MWAGNFWFDHLMPPLIVPSATPVFVPGSSPTASQTFEDVQEMAFSITELVGIFWMVQVVPPLIVDNTKAPLKLAPTASHRFDDTHQMPWRVSTVVGIF
jgi:hypothetical protein